jgi:hypothetical protein
MSQPGGLEEVSMYSREQADLRGEIGRVAPDLSECLPSALNFHPGTPEGLLVV